MADFPFIIPQISIVLLLYKEIVRNIHPIKHHYRDTHARQRNIDLFACLVTPE